MHRNYFLIIVFVALACLVLIFFSLWWEIQTPAIKEPIITPPRSPYKSYIFGVGVVEPSSEKILINAPINRMIEKINVQVGSKVKKGDLLFRLQNKDLQAELAAKQTAYFLSVAKLQRLKDIPREEDLAISMAISNTAKAELDFAKKQYDMLLNLTDTRAISQEERNRREYNYLEAKAKFDQAQADLEKTQAGTWQPDLEIARFEIMQAKAEVDRTKAQLADTEVKSPIDGTVLQMRIHEGEIPNGDSSSSPAMIIGNIEDLYVRASINQLDIPNFDEHAPAAAFVLDDAQYKFPLGFVRLEPFLIEKKNLTNDIVERVDTRVLEIIYRIQNQDRPLYVGEQMDVFIETPDLTKKAPKEIADENL